MVYVFFALLLFAGSVLVHVLYCRKAPRNCLHLRAYYLIALSFFCVYCVGVLAILPGSYLRGAGVWGMPLQITAGVIFILLVPFYLTFYRHTQLVSPSQKVLSTLSRRGALSFKDIVAGVQEEDFIGTRLADLCTSGCVVNDHGSYRLTTLGKVIVGALVAIQVILGRDIGG